MLDLFTIFTKGGIVLWCFRATDQIFTSPINSLIRGIILQERTIGSKDFEHNNLALRYKLDNELDIVLVVAFQKIIKMSYLDKFLNDAHLEFRDKYKNELSTGEKLNFDYDFMNEFERILAASESWGKKEEKVPKAMRSYGESEKSKKTVSSMIESGPNAAAKPQGKKVQIVEKQHQLHQQFGGQKSREEIIQENRKKLMEKMAGKKSPTEEKKKTPKENEKAGKKPRVWELGGDSKDMTNLDRSRDRPDERKLELTQESVEMIGSMKGVIQDLEVESEEDEDEEEEYTQSARKETKKAKSGVFSLFRGFVGSKNLTREDVEPALDKLKDHLISKNVASDIAQKLCESVASKLEGKVLGTFESVATSVKTALTQSLVQILSPKRRVDIIRDALEAKRANRPFVMAFCGVNGVGKSTNLAKICFWLIENDFSVLIAACDTFRAGAVEQLRTHTRHLNALHPPQRHNNRTMVQLYEKGYGKDAAGIAMEAIKHANDTGIDVVLVDTAGRMQDNEPLMRALAKLIKVNDPDLVLFVGEALVGNEAVDQLVKFNQALADYSSNENPHIIDGIVLTKFDTIDDKVGAAISMTYITGQPIVFVGTGQTYTDLKAINAKAVVHALMK
ncbi:signal recognition particle receptor subunit alpha homolog [Episyrphus balteatus]|uniref:signal recognition particle receptor subunit alpha homolog n=1 Tax=Episyrphus balteatus TaxID=286459 RepID=UPI0024860C68|nr:signal recognition particle receptor subunit alpha homolog [Episyrphus balteatus]